MKKWTDEKMILRMGLSLVVKWASRVHSTEKDFEPQVGLIDRDDDMLPVRRSSRESRPEIHHTSRRGW